MGGCSIDACGVPLSDEALEIAKNSDSVLLGAVGGKVGVSKWYDLAPNLRPEAGLLAIRKGMGLFAIFVQQCFSHSCVRHVRLKIPLLVIKDLIL